VSSVRKSKLSKGLTLLLLAAGPAFAQIRIEPLAPSFSASPAASVSIPSFSAALTAPSLLPLAVAFAPSAASALPVLAAPAAVAFPAAVPAALVAAPVAAAAEGPARSAKDSLSGAAKAAAPFEDGSISHRSINSFWDGLSGSAVADEPIFAAPSDGRTFLVESAGAASRAGSSPSWLALKDKKHEAALEAAVKLARSTRAGRRAFDAAQAALDASGRTLPVDVRELGRNYGEYDYLEDRLRLDRKLFLPGREADLAGTLAHELLHVAQHAQGLPSNALELEIEAHLLDLALMDELGLKPAPNTFARQAHEALAKSPKKFIELLKMAVPGSPFLGDSDFDEIAEQLESDLDNQAGKRGERAAKLSAVIAADLELVRSKKGRAIYSAFSKKVLAELSRRSAAARAR
jgi:hypothetical protein